VFLLGWCLRAGRRLPSDFLWQEREGALSQVLSFSKSDSVQNLFCLFASGEVTGFSRVRTTLAVRANVVRTSLEDLQLQLSFAIFALVR
jgi:hypothetical protein